MMTGTIGDREVSLSNWLFSGSIIEKYDWNSEFQRRFISRYMLEEIGLETPELFRYQLHNLLRMRAPYYDQLIHWMRKLQEWNPMEDDIDYTEESTNRSDKTQDSTDQGNKISVAEDAAEESADSYSETDNDEVLSGTSGETVSKTGSSSETGTVNDSGTRQDTTTYNTASTDTSSGSGLKQTSSDSEQGNSDFPQGNVSANRDYFSSGNESVSRVQEKYENSGNNTSKKTGTDSLSGTTTNESISEREGESSERTSSDRTYRGSRQGLTKLTGSDTRNYLKNQEIRDIINNIGSVIENLNASGVTRKHGRLTARNIPGMIDALQNAWFDPIQDFIESCSELFMLIY